MKKIHFSNTLCAGALPGKLIWFQMIRFTAVAALLLILLSSSIAAQGESVPDKEDPDKQTQDGLKRKIIPFQEKGSFWQFSIGTLTGKNVQQETDRMPSFSFMYSYKFNRTVSAGFGIGVDIMDYAAAPVYIDIKFHLPVNRSYFPYLYLKSGKSFSLSDSGQLNGMASRNTGGFLAGVGAGIFLPGREDFRWFLQAGYRYSELNTEMTQAWWGTSSSLLYTYPRIDVSFGVFFN